MQKVHNVVTFDVLLDLAVKMKNVAVHNVDKVYF